MQTKRSHDNTIKRLRKTRKLMDCVPPRSLVQWLSKHDLCQLVFLNKLSYQIYRGLWLERVRVKMVGCCNTESIFAFLIHNGVVTLKF